MHRRGFTLIELLVVIAIIALLIAILVPSLSKARHRARELVCGSNIRSMILAVHVYANDHKDHLVSAGLAHGGSVNEHAAWINLLEKEYGNPLVARCPVDESPHWEIPISGPERPNTKRRSSYGINYYTVKRIGNHGPYNKLGMIPRPNKTIYFVELPELGEYAASDHIHAEDWWSDPRRLASEQMAIERHKDRANYGFMDGRVEPHVFEDTYEIDYEASEFPTLAWKHNMYDPFIAR